MSEESTLSRSRSRAAASRLDRLNTATADAAEAALLACCGSRRWARLVAAHRPYPDLEALLAAGDEASYDLTPADLDEALADESVVGHELPPAESLGSPAAHTALQAAHDAYERRFGHVFVICLDGLRPEERLDRLLTGIRNRLGNERERERDNTAEELRHIARGRLVRLAANTSRLPDVSGFRIA